MTFDGPLRPALAAALLAASLTACDNGPDEPTLYRTPIAGEAGEDWYYGALPNHSGERNTAEDYNCGPKTEDFHRTTDFILPSFRAMDIGVDVVAAAAGTVTAVEDGHFDRWLQRAADREGNRVEIEHDDGFVTVYRHLREGSVRVIRGERVEAGQVIGQAGSSGDSDWPRLAFEARIADGAAFDPWSGPCSDPVSYWRSQPEYPGEFDVIDAGTTGQRATISVVAERPPTVTAFRRGDNVTFWVHVINRPPGLLKFRVLSPSGVADSAAIDYERADAANTVFGAPIVLGADAPIGSWAVEFSIDGQTFQLLPFTVQETTADPAGTLPDPPTGTAAIRTDHGLVLNGR